ncbi:MAG: lamin tail domain-containing protein [Deltaproteobacteria bacterium]|nr:lamin tail domain-containing protein [Deltaproteobacteria bacterium]
MRMSHHFLLALLSLLIAGGCSQTIPPIGVNPDDDDDAANDDDSAGDDDDATGDDDDATGDDDDATGDDDDATGDDDDATGDDDDATGPTSCTPVGALFCGSSISVDTNTGANAVSAYSCESWDESGPELSWTFAPSESQDVTISLSNPGLNADHDIFVLPASGGDCDPASCVDAGDTDLTFAASPGETYYVVIDGYLGDAGVVEFTISCEGAVGDDDDATGDDDDATSPGLLPGDIVITEIMNNPDGDDADKEWFEVLNTTGASIDLDGFVISDLGGDVHTISGTLVVPAGDVLVLGNSTSAAANAGASVDYAYGADITLANGDDELLLTSPGSAVIDEVVYDDGAGWPDVSGRSKTLDGTVTSGIDNDLVDNWCDAPETQTYGSESNFGSPGSLNPTCPSATVVLPGDVVISEIMADPIGTDGDQEWFEVLNTSSKVVDMLGWTLSDGGTDSHVVANSVVLQPGAYAVIARSSNTTANGGITANYAYGSDITFEVADALTLTEPGAAVIDTVVWTNGWFGAEGLSLESQTTSAVDNDNAANWCSSTAASYGAGGSGTPGASASPCPSGPPDLDGDGFDNTVDCNDATPAVDPAATEIPCDSIDQDSDGVDLEPDADGDGYEDCASDCDPTNPAVNPGAFEVAGNGIDDDCDGQIDEATVGCDGGEVEGNDTIATANTILGSQTMCGVINPVADVDNWRFTIGAWTQVTLDIDAQANGSQLDSYVDLLDGSGTSLADNDDEAAGNLDSLVDVILVDPGTYYAEVSDLSLQGGPLYGYELSLTATQVCDVIELEPNGSELFADPALLGDVACGTITSFLDADYYEVTVVGGTTVTFDVDAVSIGSGLESQLTLLNSSGTELDSDEPSGFNDPSITYTFSSTGTYYIVVESDLIILNDDGPYMLNITL